MRVDDGQSMLQKLIKDEESNNEQSKEETTSEERSHFDNLPEGQPLSGTENEKLREQEVPVVATATQSDETLKSSNGQTDDDKMEVDTQEEEEEEAVINLIGDYDIVVFPNSGRRMTDKFSSFFSDDDAVYEVTVDEVKKLHKERVDEVKRLTEGEDLTTRGKNTNFAILVYV